MCASLASSQVALHGEIKRRPTLPRDPPMQLYEDTFLMILLFDNTFSHTCMYCDAFCDTWRVHGPCDID